MGDKEVKDFIEHFGVRGMKWGVRKRRNEEDRKKTFGPKSSTEAKRAAAIKTKAKKSGVSSLTNKELADLNKRLQLEQQYNNLTQNDKPVRAGKKAVQEFLKTAGMVGQLAALANSPAVKMVKDMMDNKTATPTKPSTLTVKKTTTNVLKK